MEKKKSGLATAGLVLGIIGISISFIPVIHLPSLILGLLSIIFGLVSVIQKASIGKAIAAFVLGLLTLAIFAATVLLLFRVFSDPTPAGGMAQTEASLDVEIGQFTVKKDGYFEETALEVTVTNTSEQQRSFSVEIEAVDSQNRRIDTDTVFADRLNPGQAQVLECFTLVVDDDQIEALRKATFRVLNASMY